MAESDEEWDEAKKENEKLIELGETPVVTIEEYPVITDIKEMLEYDCKDSEAALPEMSKCLAMFDDDYVTKHMIQQFIVDEQEKSVTQGHAFLFFLVRILFPAWGSPPKQAFFLWENPLFFAFSLLTVTQGRPLYS